MILSEYVKSTNFASKDSLSVGNPLKIVKGTEIDAEFNNIATAVATKADLNSPTFIGTPVAPTAAGGTNSTQLATTAFANAAGSAAAVTERTATATITNKTINLANNTVTGTKAEFNTACSDADFASLAGTETLTNKTVNLTSNTVTGTKAQFNTACSDTDFSFVNDFTSSNQSLTANGYQKLPGGIIMQWGVFDSTTTTYTLTFPIAFPTACASIQFTDEYTGDTGGGTQLTALAAAPTTTGASLSTAAAVDNVYWFAIGY